MDEASSEIDSLRGTRRIISLTSSGMTAIKSGTVVGFGIASFRGPLSSMITAEVNF